MLRKIGLVFLKEMKMMIRDRRLTVSVVIISLVVMPFLMGFIGNIDRMTGSEASTVTVVLVDQDPWLVSVVERVADVQVLVGPRHGWADAALINVRREGAFIRIEGDGTHARTRAVAGEIKAAIEAEREVQVLASLQDRGISEKDLRPFEVTYVDTASEEKKSGILLSVLIPYLAIILLVSNANRALYIAVGEKEKNTLASILISNAPRQAIVIGKILSITVFAVGSSLLLVAGMILFANFGFTLARLPDGVSYSLGPGQILELIVILGTLALFIAAIIMMLGTYARTAREAGIYTTPLLFIAIFLAVFSFSSTDFGFMAYGVPVLGNALAMRDSFLHELAGDRLLFVIGSNVVLFLLLVWVSVWMYNKESVLFRA